MVKTKEVWVVFYIKGKEVCAYTFCGTFEGELKATMEQLALEHNVEINEVQFKYEWR